MQVGQHTNFGLYPARLGNASATGDVGGSVPATLAPAVGAASFGHLTNGAFSLPAWAAPVSNDPVAITYSQPIGAADALRTGTYAHVHALDDEP